MNEVNNFKVLEPKAKGSYNKGTKMNPHFLSKAKKSRFSSEARGSYISSEARNSRFLSEAKGSYFFLKRKISLLVLFCLILGLGFFLFSQSEIILADPGVSRGIEKDLWADIIIGQPDFSEISPFEVVPYKLFNPGGVIVDRSVDPGRLYVWDSGNSRILGVDLAKCYSREFPCSADIVIGQPSAYGHSACNGDSGFQDYPNRAPASASTLCGIPEDSLSPLEDKSFVSMFVDKDGNLYVPDSLNHRVLKYNSPFTTDTVADRVWGQDSFFGNKCNKGSSPTASSLCFHSLGASGAGVTLDSFGNLWVADGGNNRVLRFPKDPITEKIAKTANLVLGQPDFTRGGDWSFGEAMNQMREPAALRFDHNGRLYVADSIEIVDEITSDKIIVGRVLVFEPPFVSGMNASSTFGSDLAPASIEMDPDGEGVWTYEYSGGKIKLWDFDGVTVKEELMGGFEGGGSLGIDTNGNILASAFVYGQDVFRFSPTDKGYIQDRRLFSPPYIYNMPGPKGLRSGQGVEVVANQLIVADGGRILFWNTSDPTTLSNGKPADGVVAAPDFYTATYHADCCGRLRADNKNRLWVLAGGYTPEIRVYQLPLITGAEPIKILKFPFKVLGGGQISTTGGDQHFAGIAPVGNGDFIWVSHPATHRVFRIRNPMSNNPVVDVILGQKSVSGTQCNRGEAPEDVWTPHPDVTADMLCWPGALALDNYGNLFVSDHALEVRGNSRLLVFDASLFPTYRTKPIFAPEAIKIFPSVMAWEPAFDSSNRMVVGYNGYSGQRFVGVYNNPLGPSTKPDVYVNDYWSMPYSATFDDNDNLYIADLNRARVLIYKRAFVERPIIKISCQDNDGICPEGCTPKNDNDCIRGDIDYNSQVNINDVKTLLRVPEVAETPAADLNSDGVINGADFWQMIKILKK